MILHSIGGSGWIGLMIFKNFADQDWTRTEKFVSPLISQFHWQWEWVGGGGPLVWFFLIFHMTQLINGSNTKRHRTLSKPTVSEH